MRKFILYFLLFACFCSVYGQKKPAHLSRVSVAVQPSMEMMSVIHYLAGYLEMPETSYADSVKTYFAPYKNHEAVLRLRKLIATRSQQDAGDLLHFGRYFVDGKYQTVMHPIDSLLLKSYYNPKEWKRFTLAVADFYQKTNFAQFLKNQNPYYQVIVKQTQDFVNSDKYTIPEIEAFFQDKTQARWKLYICPLMTHIQGQTLLSLSPKNNTFSILLGYPLLDSSALNAKKRMEMFQHVLIHESAHLYVSNVVFKDYMQKINDLRTEKNAKEGVFLWWNKVDESITHGISIFVEFTYLHNQLVWERDISICSNAGFLFTEKTIECVRYYDANRAKYKQFQDFLPYLFQNLK